MKSELNTPPSPVLFIPHGGGPLPLLGDTGHQNMLDFLRKISPTLGRPSAILVISAHWEENIATITSGKAPSLIYDYFGFPDEAYKIEYPAAGDPVLANKIFNLLHDSGIEAKLDEQRGFDHGLFVPLKIMFPDASIPCVQLSLISSMDPEAHINMGKALAELREENILVIGSGFSFHNLKQFFSQSGDDTDVQNDEFEHWLIDTCTDKELTPQERETRLMEWSNAPSARYCHPREDHLLPLFVCYGIANSAAELVFDDKILGKKSCAFLW